MGVEYYHLGGRPLWMVPKSVQIAKIRSLLSLTTSEHGDLEVSLE